MENEAEQNGQHVPGQGYPQDEELARLRCENEVLLQEREMLKSHQPCPLVGTRFSNQPVNGRVTTLKKEKVHRKEYLTHETPISQNQPVLLHRSLHQSQTKAFCPGYLSPHDYEQALLN